MEHNEYTSCSCNTNTNNMKTGSWTVDTVMYWERNEFSVKSAICWSENVFDHPAQIAVRSEAHNTSSLRGKVRK